ncbi:Protein kinase-like domain protein [Cordyceps fumosorosea ARSEF 2679]|uniref:Protein kinase-like domain protein n=1 Tax=Cordyceps fumosorosea (strain ARSEF 2679) TaxID=1081104 RepID=A0A162IDV4_CORFA|nr:Protein kinase-like domain protein [Cordyceps fumosorosea ARSEF 2679]OAA55765.1 Protein kinase-like domain protein [Cordyceps fumosorosea ARSEF 2679]
MSAASSSSDHSGSFSSTKTGQDGPRAIGDANTERYDILTFFAQFVSILGHSPAAVDQVYLLMIFLDELTYQLPRERGSGRTSRVAVVKSEAILERGIYRHDKPILPELIAVKMTKASTIEGATSVDQTLLRSMATELRILSNDTIRSHDNIITLLGICWQQSNENQDVLLPVFVYETSELGDLKTWLPENKDIALGVQLDLCLGIARGLACLHEAGVVHCDIKPDNILVVWQDDPKSSIVAKIIDFNIAVLFQDAPDRVPLPAGTSPWNSPEQMTSTFIYKGDLPKVDVYSLGVLLLNILTVDCLNTILNFIATGGIEGQTLLDFKLSGALALNSGSLLGEFGLVSGPEVYTTHVGDFRRCWAKSSLLLFGALDGDLRHRTGSVAQIVDELARINKDAEEYGLRDYTNRDLHIVARAAETLQMVTNPGEQRCQVSNS